MKSWKILSVGGSIIVPQGGFDVDFLKGFRRLILKRISQGEKFIIVIGGGAPCRDYQNAARALGKVTPQDLDWIGIGMTKVNAEFVRVMFGDLAYSEILSDPTKKVKTAKPIIVAGGWKPGFTTDHSAVKFAEVYGVTEVYNLSNISYVYDKDPKKFVDAVKIERTDWKHFCDQIIPKDRTPGMNTPFDPMASKVAKKLNLKVSFVDGRNLKEVEKALSGKKFMGTVIE